ncbi:MAG: hypothetical protein GJT30_02210 [Geobacter sp.]|nr:hypothetical protein [Geobacter sp.]
MRRHAASATLRRCAPTTLYQQTEYKKLRAIMPKAGSEYTEEAAKFFRTLGLTAEIEKRVVGARGTHNIDVWITGKIQSFQVRWIIECKDWKSSVPKEKVLALQAIAMDIGSDRAFLLSESGFQAGAVRCSQFTNITLTSLNDLREQTREQFAQTALWTLYARVSQVIDDLNKEPARIYLAGPATGCLYDNPEISQAAGSQAAGSGLQTWAAGSHGPRGQACKHAKMTHNVLI